jgi:hypothetical protein
MDGFMLPQELGYNAVQLRNVRDCWVRDIATINADNTVLMNGALGCAFCQGCVTLACMLAERQRCAVP